MRFSKSIFAKFCLCKKALKTSVSLKFLKEKDLLVNTFISPGGYLKNALFSFFFLLPEGEPAADGAVPRPASLPAVDKDPRRTLSISSLFSSPQFSLSLALLRRSTNPNPSTVTSTVRRVLPPLRPSPCPAVDLVVSVVPASISAPSLACREAPGSPNFGFVLNSGRRLPGTIPPPSGPLLPRRPLHRDPGELSSLAVPSAVSLPPCIAPAAQLRHRRRQIAPRRPLRQPYGTAPRPPHSPWPPLSF